MLQALHPIMMGLLPKIEAQRASGEGGLQARLAVLEAQLESLEAAAEMERKAVLAMDKNQLLVSK
jgi:ABC-type phosphate transport system auxiliary subunit